MNHTSGKVTGTKTDNFKQLIFCALYQQENFYKLFAWLPLYLFGPSFGFILLRLKISLRWKQNKNEERWNGINKRRATQSLVSSPLKYQILAAGNSLKY